MSTGPTSLSPYLLVVQKGLRALTRRRAGHGQPVLVLVGCSAIEASAVKCTLSLFSGSSLLVSPLVHFTLPVSLSMVLNFALGENCGMGVGKFRLSVSPLFWRISLAFGWVLIPLTTIKSRLFHRTHS